MATGLFTDYAEVVETEAIRIITPLALGGFSGQNRVQGRRPNGVRTDPQIRGRLVLCAWGPSDAVHSGRPLSNTARRSGICNALMSSS